MFLCARGSSPGSGRLLLELAGPGAPGPRFAGNHEANLSAHDSSRTAPSGRGSVEAPSWTQMDFLEKANLRGMIRSKTKLDRVVQHRRQGVDNAILDQASGETNFLPASTSVIA